MAHAETTEKLKKELEEANSKLSQSTAALRTISWRAPSTLCLGSAFLSTLIFGNVLSLLFCQL